MSASTTMSILLRRLLPLPILVLVTITATLRSAPPATRPGGQPQPPPRGAGTTAPPRTGTQPPGATTRRAVTAPPVTKPVTPASVPVAAPVDAGGVPATAPSLPPPRPRYQMVMPPGYSALTVGPRTALCEPGDETWVRQVLDGIKPTTLPTTMPATIVQRLTERRDLLKVRLSTDLALPDASAALDKLFDEQIAAAAQRLGRLDPPVFYLVCTDVKLKSLLKNGWTDPRYYYNRAADDVAFSPELNLTDDRPMDDMVMPVIFREDATAEVKQKTLDEIVRRNEAAIADAISRRGMVVTQLALIDFIHKQGVEPLKLKDDQQWFGMGIEAVLSARYMNDFAGLNFDELVARMTFDNPRNPIRSSTVDLIHPANKSDMRPEWIPVYGDAYRAKSAKVVYKWYKDAGESAVSVTLRALREKVPADGPGLIALIKLTSNVDLTEAVKPR